ncbi:hypothetical protein MMC21_006663 [Puttea exsequens]|nr:hypothetical protein [Puttea exsequens]
MRPDQIQGRAKYPPVFVSRVVLTLILGSMVILPSVYQSFLDKTYTYMLQSKIYQASTFETFWTVLVYSIVEASYTYRFRHSPQLRLSVQKDGTTTKPPPKMQRPQNRIREGFTYIVPLLFLDLTMIKKLGGVLVDDMALSGNYDPNSVTMKGSFLAPTLHRFTWDSPLQIRRALPRAPPTSRQLVLQLLASIIIYDAVFFWFHLALHKLPLLSRFHSVHHKHGEIYPQITNQLDVFERLTLILLANFSLNIISSHVLTRTLFVPMFVWLLVDIHSGMDQKWGYDKLLPKGWGAGSKRHSHHHQYGTMYYEPFFNWWDDALQWAANSRKDATT